ncbi:hypothetical protein DB30_02857 [Enhygromyxa salina]|uniref:CHAT domain-containing protein n=1 Tax=Enhygromyxa salina TaxID=215803 RepID=A0A0C2CKE1_9BACT|nr:CHAT domain-containing protein [Enhygromyxa salina]KIG11686.1 hypothetical protein DB30_02857 [Enhygromyxa salina]
MTAPNPAAILLFANSQHLPALEEEESSIRDALDPLVDRGILSEVYVINNASIDAAIASFRVSRLRSCPLIVHIGGHAADGGLMFRSHAGIPELAHGQSLAGYIGAQNRVELVFLNGCTTESMVEGLRNSGVKAVIATSSLIEDKTAAEFARHFYAELSDRPLREAFRLAAHATQIRWRETTGSPWPWILSVDPAHEGWTPAHTSQVPDCAKLEDLVELARTSKLERPVRRRRVLRELQRLTISQHTPRIVLLRGPDGSGRRSLIDDLAHHLAEQSRPQPVSLLRAKPSLATSEVADICARLDKLKGRVLIHLSHANVQTDDAVASLIASPQVRVLLSTNDEIFAGLGESLKTRASNLNMPVASNEELTMVLERVASRLGIDVTQDALAEIVRLVPTYAPRSGDFGAVVRLLEDASAYAEFPSTGYRPGASDPAIGRVTEAIIRRIVAVRSGTPIERIK